MAYSNTVSQTVFNTRRVIDNAVRRCKLTAQQITAEHIDIANDQLYLFLSDLANQGTPLWCIQRSIYPIYSGLAQLTTYEGTVDILNSNLRSLQAVSGTVTEQPAFWQTDFTTDTFVTTVGIKWTGTAVPLALQRSDDGLAWTTVQTETPNASAGMWTWFDLATVVASRYFRILATSGTLSYSRVYLGNTPTEIPLARMNRDDYTNLPNKAFLSNRPLQYWLDRQSLSPVLNFWPTPNDAAEVQQIVVWAQRQIMDVGTMTQEIEVPQRWLEAIVAGLAAKMALELVEVDVNLIPILDQKAAISLNIAQMEERDNSPMMIAPNISPYTR
jgi:hypothetical protein